MADEDTSSGNSGDAEIKQPPPPDYSLFEPKSGMTGLIPFFETGRPVCSVPSRNEAQSLVVTGQATLDQIADDTHYDKLVVSGLDLLRVAGTSLFMADTDDPEWRLAHKLIMPAFGAAAIKSYLPAMTDPAMQLVLKWARLNPGEEIDVTADFTRLTFETIGLVGFGYRFGAFYSKDPDPFVDAMTTIMMWAIRNGDDPEVTTSNPPPEVAEAVQYMNTIVEKVVADRRANPKAGEVDDLLGHMLEAKDQETGQGLSDENIRAQIITFLVAGHETTSGLLSFCVYYLINNPDVLARAYAEVDEVLGDDLTKLPTFEQVHKLTYIMQIMSEALRLWPGAPFIIRHSLEDEVLLDEYPVTPEDLLQIFLPSVHRDPNIWPEPEKFDPDRFTPEAQAALPPNSYLPFGVGQRSCIGRPFALIEAQLALALVLQRFEFIDHSNYELSIRRGLTIKPRDFHIQVKPRDGREAQALRAAGGAEAISDESADSKDEAAVTATDPNGFELTVLYGSNLGTSEGVARKVAADAARAGFEVTMGPLDEYAEGLPTDGGVVIVTSSYNGQPPDNSMKFKDWIQNLKPESLKDVRYTVFGCGDRNWASTFQAFPKLIDEKLAGAGAKRLSPLGAGDASDDFDGQFREWYSQMWNDVNEAFGLQPSSATAPGGSLILETGVPIRKNFLANINAVALTVASSTELQGKSKDGTPDRSTRLIELELPDGLTYNTGDHIAILPINPVETVLRTLTFFEAEGETMMTLHADGPTDTSLPLDSPRTLGDLLLYYTELQKPATRAQIEMLAGFTTDPGQKARLEAVSGQDDESRTLYREEVLTKRRSIIDLLEENDSCRPPDAVLLDMLGELTPRFYSIASSPVASPKSIALMVGVLDDPSWSGHGTYHGTSSTFLSRRAAGSAVHGAIRPPGMPFAPPADPLKPMIMIATGAGLAPFRGFLQERAVAAVAHPVGKSLLFYGCRNSGADYLLKDDLAKYQATDVVEVIPAYSDEPGLRRKFVQDRMRDRQDQIWDLIEQGATVYVCGHAGRVAPAARAMFEQMYRDKTDATAEAAEAWVQELRDTDRYLEDIWAG